MGWETKVHFEITFATRSLKSTCDRVDVLDGGVLRIINDHNGAITHLYARHAWVQCDVWEESV